jgi:hypothetical protein
MWITRGGKKRSGGERLIEMNGGRGASTRTENIGVTVEGNGSKRSQLFFLGRASLLCLL